MIKFIMNGCNGKMGQVITRLAAESENYRIVAGIDAFNETTNDYPVYKTIMECKEKADAIIDFSHPSMLESLLYFACSNKIPVVVATTGLSNQQINKLRQASEHIPVFFSANMSLGINLLIDLVNRSAKLLEDSFDIEIIEKHHNQKIDAPSGTALAIADALSASLTKNPDYVYDRHSVRKKRSKGEIGFHAVRGGTIVGEHEVIFAGTDEIIEIKHSAMSKEIFGVGAMKAAAFVFDKKPGMYNMKDLVNSL